MSDLVERGSVPALQPPLGSSSEAEEAGVADPAAGETPAVSPVEEEIAAEEAPAETGNHAPQIHTSKDV